MTFDERFPPPRRSINWQVTVDTGYSHGGGQDGISVLQCHECRALVVYADAEAHSDWHDRLERHAKRAKRRTASTPQPDDMGDRA